jgi:hypothetical protein
MISSLTYGTSNIILMHYAVQVMELLAAHFAQWACSPAFPEMVQLPLQQLRRFGKKCKVERFRSSAKALSAALEGNFAHVAGHRASNAFAPKDTASVLSFLVSDNAQQGVRAQTLLIFLIPDDISKVSCKFIAGNLRALPYLHYIAVCVPWLTRGLREDVSLLQAPLQVYARMLAQKAQQRRDLQRADMVQADREDNISGDDEELQAGSGGSAQASRDPGEVLSASALYWAQKKATNTILVRERKPKVQLSAPGAHHFCPCIWDIVICVLQA